MHPDGLWVRIEALDFDADLVGLVVEVPQRHDALCLQISGSDHQVRLD